MPPWLQTYLENRREYRRLLKMIERDLSDDLQVAEKAGWDESVFAKTKIDIRRLFTLSGRLSLALLLCAFLPLIFVIGLLVTHDAGAPYSAAYSVFGLWVMTVAVVAMWIFWPLVGVLRTLRRIPDPAYRQLVQPIWINLDLLNITINISLMLYVLLSLKIDRAYPIVVILSALWLFAPLALFFAHRDAFFAKLRMTQLAVLFLTAFFVVLSPVPIKDLQWWARKEMADKLRVVSQEEITSKWETLQWFTPEGLPTVWYSEKEGGYHLFAGPGHDPDTNQELKEVADKATKEKIVASLRARDLAQARKGAAERERTAADARIKEESATRTRIAVLAAETERAAKEKEIAAERLVNEYVFANYRSGASKTSTVLIAINGNREENATLTRRFLGSLKSAGVTCITEVFTPAFFFSDTFGSLMSARVPTGTFPVSGYAARLLVIQIENKPVQGTSAGTQNMVSVETSLKLRLISTKTGSIEFEDEITERGVGFKESTALSNALDRAEARLGKVAAQMTALR